MDNDDSKKNFFKHVFNFDEDSKCDILNIIQYSLLAIIPIVALNKTISKYIPEADELKGSVEITAEIAIQVIIMFIGLLIIHRIIIYIPTYSGYKYPEFNIIFIILAVLMITLSLQTKIGEKISILVDRISELWNGKKEKQSKNKNNIKVTQPLANQQQQQMSPPSNFSDGTSISSLPMTTSSIEQPLPNYNQSQGANINQTQFDEPMAANSLIGSSFSSW